MAISKELISSPIEAGTSLLDTQKLPLQMLEALDYVSTRLLRKHLHLTLIVVRDDAQQTQKSPLMTPPLSIPTRSPSLSSLSSRLSQPSHPDSTKSNSSVPRSDSNISSKPTSSLWHQRRTVTALPKLTPIDTTPFAPNPYGISLLHASTLSPKASRHLHETVAKASKKYSLGDGWISAPATPTSPVYTSPSTIVPLGDDLIRRSLQQNDLLFSNEGLTLLSLDHVYSFKIALSAYSRLLFPRLPSSASSDVPNPDVLGDLHAQKEAQEAAKIQAVDKLRLLTLSQNGRAISKSYLFRAYDHLSISLSALREVNNAYKMCYQTDGVEIEAARPPIPHCQLLRSKSGRERSQVMMEDGIQRLDRGPHFKAPMTPGGYDDVTPITRGEWHWLMGASEPRIAAVETC